MRYQKPLDGDPDDLTGRVVANLMDLAHTASVLGKLVLQQSATVTPGTVKAIKLVNWVDRNPGIGRDTDGDHRPRLLSLNAWMTYSQTGNKMAEEARAALAGELASHPSQAGTVALLQLDTAIATGKALSPQEPGLAPAGPRF